MSFLFNSSSNETDDNNAKSYQNYRTLFFAGFVVAPESSPPSSSSQQDPHQKVVEKPVKKAVDPYDIKEVRRKLEEIKQRNDKRDEEEEMRLNEEKHKNSRTNNNSNIGNNNSTHKSSASSSTLSPSSLQSLVEDLFVPYGDIDFFYFDYQTGAGVVQFTHGKSGENCYLMSHLLPFTMTTKKSSSTNNNKSTENPKSGVKNKTTSPNDNVMVPHGQIQQHGQYDDDDDDEDEQPSSFSLVCLEYASILPFSPESRKLFATSPHAWVSSRKNLSRLNIINFGGEGNNNSNICSNDGWKQHLDFMQSQRARKKLYFKNLSWLRHELLVADDSSDDDENEDSDGNNSNSNKLPKKRKLSAEAASEAQEIIEEHLASLLFASSSSNNNTENETIKKTEAVLFEQLQTSDFWNLMLLPSCLDKIVSQLCEIDIDEVGISMSSSTSSPSNSPTKRSGKKHDEQEQLEIDETHLEKKTRLMISMIHSSISILDIWLSIYQTFYSGERARVEHSSIVAVLEGKLMTAPDHQQESSSSKKGPQPVNFSLRHPAWPSFAISNLTEEARRKSMEKESLSLAIQRRTDFIKLYSGQLEPLHLGLKAWPGGESDDVGSSYRAVLAMLNSARSFYLDQSFRHMWTSLFACEASASVNDNNHNDGDDDKSSTNTNNNSVSAVIVLLTCLREVDAKIKKQFLAVSSKQEALLDGAWHILYRASWRMETAFSLIISYLKMSRDEFESISPSSSSRLKKKKGPNNSSGNTSNTKTKFDEFFEQLLDLDPQPPLWPLLRPVDSLEIDWGRGRGVLCDESIVYRRLFDGDEEFSKLHLQQAQQRRNKNNNNRGNNPQDELFWEGVVLPTAGWILQYVFGQNPAVLHSRYYRRKFIQSLMSFVPPIIVMTIISVQLFFLFKWGYVAAVQDFLWLNLVEPLSFF